MSTPNRNMLAPLVQARTRNDVTFRSVTLVTPLRSNGATSPDVVALCLTPDRSRLRLGIIFDLGGAPSETSVVMTRQQALELALHLSDLRTALRSEDDESTSTRHPLDIIRERIPDARADETTADAVLRIVRERDALRSRLSTAAEIVHRLPRHGHDGDEETGEHDADCEACICDELRACLDMSDEAPADAVSRLVRERDEARTESLAALRAYAALWRWAEANVIDGEEADWIHTGQPADVWEALRRYGIDPTGGR